MKRRSSLYFSGSTTIEASFLIPVCFFVIILLINLSAYLYNKETLESVVAICAIHGAQLEQKSQKEIQQKVEIEIEKELTNRFLFHPEIKPKVSCSAYAIRIEVSCSQVLVGGRFLRIFHIKDTLSFGQSKKITRYDPARIIWEAGRLKKQSK